MTDSPEKPESKLWQRLEAVYASKLPFLAKAVLAYYHLRARNDQRTAVVSTQRMMQDLGLSRASIQRQRDLLAMEGWIFPEERWWKDTVARKDRRVLKVYTTLTSEVQAYAEQAAEWCSRNGVPYKNLSFLQTEKAKKKHSAKSPAKRSPRRASNDSAEKFVSPTDRQTDLTPAPVVSSTDREDTFSVNNRVNVNFVSPTDRQTNLLDRQSENLSVSEAGLSVSGMPRRLKEGVSQNLKGEGFKAFPLSPLSPKGEYAHTAKKQPCEQITPAPLDSNSQIKNDGTSKAKANPTAKASTNGKTAPAKATAPLTADQIDACERERCKEFIDLYYGQCGFVRRYAYPPESCQKERLIWEGISRAMGLPLERLKKLFPEKVAKKLAPTLVVERAKAQRQ